MAKKLQNNLPNSQSISINDKLLWMMIRIQADNNKITVSELIEIGMKEFMVSSNRDARIESYKLDSK